MATVTPFAAKSIHRENLTWVLLAQAISILPLLIKLPLWIWGIWLFALFWRLQIYRGRWGYPHAWIKFALGAICIGGIWLSYSGISGVESMVGFLVCSFVLKLIEMRTSKDALMVLFIGFIAVAAQFLFAQGVVAALAGFVSLLVLLTAWQAAFSLQALTVSQHLRRGIALVVTSLPLMVVFFVVMPRLGPLWSVPLPQGSGQTGFSDSLKLGDIGRLVRSPEVAFRVSFEGSPPLPENLYWRGLVLDRFDGRTWKASGSWTYASQKAVPQQGTIDANLRYSVILEPHYERWLFALGTPVESQSAKTRIYIDDRGLLESRLPVTQKMAYEVHSTLTYRSAYDSLTSAEREILTALPEEGNPRAKQLAQLWAGNRLTDQQIVQRALSLFRREFSYTLRPPTLGAQAIDEFLFTTRKGFCEHFASSFVYLMRAAHIPARLVVGYQGGQRNEVEDYVTVRQSDAHAWAEVWIEGKGWQSLDPTGAVAPSRIELGVEQALAEDDRELIQHGVWRTRWLHRFHQHWDALGYSWNRWVLNYDSQIQQGFLSWLLGNNSPWRVGLAFIGICGLVVASLVLVPWLRSLKKTVTRPENRLVQPVFSQLQKKGFTRDRFESLPAFARRVAASYPALQPYLKELAKAYEAAAYAEDDQAFERLQRQVENFPAPF